MELILKASLQNYFIRTYLHQRLLSRLSILKDGKFNLKKSKERYDLRGEVYLYSVTEVWEKPRLLKHQLIDTTLLMMNQPSLALTTHQHSIA
jgi:hypothetical protein